MKLKSFVKRQARDIYLSAGRQGFTLIEIIVVLGVLGIIIVSIFTVLNGAFKTNNRVKWSERVEQNGTFILGELKKNILNAGNIISCGIGSSVSFDNAVDGNTTTIVCENEKISSISATTVDLTDSKVKILDCNTFVSCDTLPSLEVTNVNFSFNLSAGVSGSGAEDYATRKFQSKITVRN